MRPLTLIFVIGTLSLVGCGGNTAPLSTPNSANPTSAPAPQSSSAPSPNRAVLFQDDFANKNGGWDQQSSDSGGSDYGDGFYSIRVKSPNYSIWANPNSAPSFGDVAIDVNAVIASGPEDAGMGSICRYQDINNFMHATITADGYYGIVLVKNGTATVLTGGGSLAQSDVIKTDKTSNHIEFTCKGNAYTLTINGQKVDSVNDGSIAEGAVGLIGNTFDNGGVEIHFNHFVVSKP